MKNTIAPSLLAALTLAVVNSFTQSVPALINYQGQLSQPNGQPLPTADYELRFGIWDAATGGNVVWGPQLFDGQTGPGHGAKVPVVQGYFNVMLGPVDTDGRSIADAFSATNRFLAVQVGNNESISPRQQILSAPFALRAATAEKLAAGAAPPAVTVDNSGRVGIGGGPNGEDTAFINGRLAIPIATSEDNNSPSIVAAGTSPDDFFYAANYLNNYGFGFHSYKDKDFSTPALNTYVSGYFGINFFTQGQRRMRIGLGGDVGIGDFESNVPDPMATLHLYGNQPELLLQQNPGIAGGPTLRLQATGNADNILQIVMHGLTLQSASGGGGDYLRIYNSSKGDLAYFAAAGNVGIGTTSPQAKLHVAGDTQIDGDLKVAGTRFRELAPPGSIMAFAGPNRPAGWLLCDGSVVSRTQYAELYAAIGTAWGTGNGTSTFNLPDLRGRVVMGTGKGTGLSLRSLGQTLGEETHKLTVDEMPSHKHFSIGSDLPNWPYGSQGGPLAGFRDMDSNNPLYGTTAAGGDQPHNVIQPSAVVSYIIKY